MVTDFKIVRLGFVIPYYSHMNSSPKIRVNPCKSVVKIIKSIVKINEICANLWNLRIEFVESENFFMKNEPNFKKAEINTSPYITNGYVNFCSLGRPKNEPKTKPNEPNSNPNRTQIEPNSNPNKANFLLIWVY